MNIEIYDEEYTRQLLLNGDVSLQLLNEVSEYLNTELLDVTRVLCNNFLSGVLNSDVMVVTDQGKIIAGAIFYIDYKHVHTGCRTLVADAMFGIAGQRAANIKLLKAMYAYAQMHSCTYIQTTQYMGKRGNSMRFTTGIRKLTE